MTEPQDLERYAEEFEQAYLQRGHADLSDFMPSVDHPQYQDIVVELVRSDMELSWQHSAPRMLEDYRQKFPQVFRNSQNLERVAFEEYRLRSLAGHEVTPADYQLRYAIKTYHWPVLTDARKEPGTADDTDHDRDVPTPSPGSQSRQARQVDLAVRLGSSSEIKNITTVESRLHRRLRFIGLTFTILLIYASLLVIWNPSQKVGLFLGSSILVALNTICLGFCAVVTVYLWVRRSVSLSRLRIFEICLFGLILLELSVGLISDLFIDHELREPLQDDHLLFHYSSSWCLPFFALIVAYGTLVPSGWRRCTIVVCIMGVTPIVICAAAAGMEHGFTWSFFQSFLLQMVLWMGTAAAIAIYGVHRLEALEKRFVKSGKLGKYRLIKQLGAGAMGTIYLAEDTLLERQCAVKLMLQSRANDPQLFTRFEREVKVLAAISHSNVVQIFDYGHSDRGVFYYVMEFLEGCNLEQLVNKYGPLQVNQVCDAIFQVCAALTKVHQCGLVHRDIKPSNLFVCEAQSAGKYKLLDFGLVKTTCLQPSDDKLTREGAIIGTPAFMSPEQASGGLIDVRSDIYSLGAVAFYMLTGLAPFDKKSVVETLTAHIHEPPPPLQEIRADLPDQLAEVISRCLAKDPASRFQTAAELQQVISRGAAAT